MFDRPEDNTAAHDAVFGKPADFVRKLEKGNFDAYLATRSLGNTPLMLALKTGQQALAIAIIKHARSSGVDVGINSHDQKGCFPLHWAAQLRMDRAIQALLDTGAVVCPIKASCWADGALGEVDPATLTPAALYRAEWTLESLTPVGAHAYQDAGPDRSVHNPLPAHPTLGDSVFHGPMLGRHYCKLPADRFVSSGIPPEGAVLGSPEFAAAVSSVANHTYNFGMCRESLHTSRQVRAVDKHLATRLDALELEHAPSDAEVEERVTGLTEVAGHLGPLTFTAPPVAAAAASVPTVPPPVPMLCSELMSPALAFGADLYGCASLAAGSVGAPGAPSMPTMGAADPYGNDSVSPASTETVASAAPSRGATATPEYDGAVMVL